MFHLAYSLYALMLILKRRSIFFIRLLKGNFILQNKYTLIKTPSSQIIFNNVFKVH